MCFESEEEGGCNEMRRLWPELCCVSRKSMRKNMLHSLLLQRRLQWKHADNEDGITQSV